MLEDFSSPLSLWRRHRAQREAGVLMAKATYEPLTREEQSRLDVLCRAYPDLAAEQDKFISFARNFRVSDDALPFDLSARIANALATPAPQLWYRRHAGAYLAAAAVVLLMVAVYGGVMLFDSPGMTGGDAGVQVAAAPSSDSMNLSLALQSAQYLLEDRENAQAAALLLEEAITENRDLPLAGEALLLLADIEYRYLQRFDQAFIAYDDLRAAHPDVFTASLETETRYEMLAETRDVDYEPLYILADERLDAGNDFDAFEHIVVTYPNTTLAMAAVDRMRTLIKDARNDSDLNVAEELELVRNRWSDPVAVAQVDLILGHYYCNEVNDRICAMEAYNRAVAGNHMALSREAHQALSRMR